ncbi:MAG: anaerobic carbon-monoxide dehydrogenase catalytic subunit [Deltaproteobacteria bacterium]|nr:anaerobic carbon-monoxide dehydrogenase catalytic subunit [Deltaproteobacteria bacterium]
MANAKVADTASEEILGACGEKLSLSFDRWESQQPQCKFGLQGLCCRHCSMGPCRIHLKGGEPSAGVCGATADTIAARHFGRMVAAGTSAHSDHGRGVAEVFLAAAKGQAEGYGIKDELKLLKLASELGVPIGERSTKEIAIEIGERLLAAFGQQHGELPLVKLAPLKRQELWRKHGLVPRGIDREVVEMMHRTAMGVDQEYHSLIAHASRTALGDGWGGSMIATQLQDIMFGTPVPLVAEVNLGTLRPEEVNVIVHGHEPLLSEMIVAAAQDPEMLAMARQVGAKGISLSGICCTSNEILMRHGIPIAGNFLQQELAIASGMCEAMVVDVQCVMQSLPKVASCFHTKIITTNERARLEGVTHIPFDEHRALQSAKAILRAAIENFPRRKDGVRAPTEKMDLVAGFSYETINYLLGGTFRASLRPLNDNIINGRIRGVAGVVGCNNPRQLPVDDYHVKMVKELIAHDVIVLQTGCSAIASAKAGLLVPEAAAKYAGRGLAEVCEAVGIPPVLHMGSCVDNSRILLIATAVVKEGGLGDDLSDLPAAGAAPEWMSEKAIAIGQYFVASGVFTVFSGSFPTVGASRLTEYLFNGISEELGGKWALENDPIKAAHLMIAHIDSKRKALGIDRAKERVLMDMAARRAIE